MENFTIPRPRLVNFKVARRSEFSTAAVASLKEDRNPEQVYLQEDGGGGLCRGRRGKHEEAPVVEIRRTLLFKECIKRFKTKSARRGKEKEEIKSASEGVTGVVSSERRRRR